MPGQHLPQKSLGNVSLGGDQQEIVNQAQKELGLGLSQLSDRSVARCLHGPDRQETSARLAPAARRKS